MMKIVSVPPIIESIFPTLKRDEEIICTDAIVIADSKGNISWIDKSKMFNIIGKEE